MEIKDLLENLETQKKNLASLLNSAIQKQKAMIESNYESLESSIWAEERAIALIQSSEKSRIKILTELYSRYSVKYDSPKLAEFVEKTKAHVEKKSLGKILASEKEMKSLIKQVTAINQQNRYLIESSRAFIKETISSLINANKTLLDKRV
ncbi:MAG: flagellar export chaperone FlgN [Bacillota bacterium]